MPKLIKSGSIPAQAITILREKIIITMQKRIMLARLFSCRSSISKKDNILINLLDLCILSIRQLQFILTSRFHPTKLDSILWNKEYTTLYRELWNKSFSNNLIQWMKMKLLRVMFLWPKRWSIVFTHSNIRNPEPFIEPSITPKWCRYMSRSPVLRASGQEHCILDSCCISPTCKEPRVIIVGAGMAGLSAAHRLTQCGIRNFVVLEAKERPGGRIHSCWLGDAVIEMGAEWIYGACLPNSVYTLASQDRLLQTPLPRLDSSRGLFCTSEGRAIDLPVTITAYHTFRQIEQQAANLFRLGCEKMHGTLLNFIGLRIQQELHNFPEDQRYDAARVMFGLTNILRNKCGDDLSLVSADQYGSYIELPGGTVRVPLGYVGVIAPLLRGLPDNCVRYNKPVNVIRWGPGQTGKGRVLVKCCDGEELTADYVIVTISLGCLKCQADKLFAPPLPMCKLEAICSLGYGLSDKVFLEYAEPYWVCHEGNLKFAWSAEELQCRCDWLRGVCSVDEMPGSKHVLCATISGQEAALMESMPENDVAEGLTCLLRRFTGNPCLPYPQMLLRSRWASDPHFCGSYSYMGCCSTVSHQCELGTPVPGPCDPQPPILLFAGEATVPGHFGTVHAARLSGVRESERIIQLTKKFDGPPR